MSTLKTPFGVLNDHVRESNAIEEIHVHHGHPLFHCHRDAAALVARDPESCITDPRIIHRALLKGIVSYAGRYRNAHVYVGEHRMPRPDTVQSLMDLWREYAQQIVAERESVSKKELKLRIWVLHNMFLCIHPFEDGNGRTARLLLNALRLLCGLEWHVVHFSDCPKYYAKIRAFEEQAFRPLFSDNY